MQTGHDQSWSRPYTPPSDSDPEVGSGTHVGPYACLNIRNRQPGFRYAYGTRQDPGGLTSMRSMGFQFIREGEPEGMGLDLPAGFGNSPDSIIGMGNLVAMKIPLDVYRKRMDEAQAARIASRAGPTRQILDRNSEFSRAYNRAPANLGAVFAYPEHGATGYKDNNSLDPENEE